MGLFKPDLFRNFAIGFALGAAILGISRGENLLDSTVPQAHAAVAER